MDWKHQKLNNTAETLIWEYIDGRLIWLMTKLWLKSTNWSGKKLAWISSDYFESLLLPQLLRGEHDSKQSDEFQARKKPEYTILQIFLSLLPKKEQENFLRKRLKYTRLPSRYKKPTRVSASLCDLYARSMHARCEFWQNWAFALRPSLGEEWLQFWKHASLNRSRHKDR